MTSFATLAANSAAAVRLSVADRHQHREECAMCRPDQECPRAANLYADHVARVQRARSNLLTYLPHGSAITYAGKLSKMHGEWWVTATCADCDHTAYRLVRPRGMALRHVLQSEITSAPILQPGAAETLPATREAAREVAAILAMCNVALPMIVDINGLGVCTLAYPYATWEHEIGVADSADSAETSYVLGALTAVPVLASAAISGDVAGIERMTEVLGKVRAAARDVRSQLN
jgi:hypothetical protein